MTQSFIIWHFCNFVLFLHFFVCVQCNFFLSSFWIYIFLWSTKRCSPLKKSYAIFPTKMFPSEVKFDKRKQSVVLPTKHNLLEIAKVNLQQQKLHKNYHLLTIPMTVHLLFSPLLSSHHTFDALISWLYFKTMVKEK